jgi:hypothetical protein
MILQAIDFKEIILEGITKEQTSVKIEDKTIYVDNAVIENHTNLNCIRCQYNLIIRNSTFKEKFDVSGSYFSNSVTFEMCRFEQNINFQGVCIDGDLSLSGCEIIAGELLREAANFDLIQIKGRLIANAIKGKQLHCTGTINFNSAKVFGKVDFSGAKIDKDLYFQQAEIEDLRLREKEKYQAEIGGKLWLLGIKSKGQISLRGSIIHGDVELQAAVLGDDLDLRPGLNITRVNGNIILRRIDIKGDAELGKCEVKGEVNLEGAEIKGKLICTQAKFNKLNLDGGRVLGEVNLNCIQIQSDLILKGADIRGGLKIMMEENNCADIKNHIKISGSKILGGVDLSGAKIGGYLSFKGAEISGDVDCKFDIVKEDVDFTGAKIFGQVDFTGVNVEKDINFTGTKIERNLIFERSLNHDLRVKNLILEGSEIKGELRCTLDKILGEVNLQMCIAQYVKLDIHDFQNLRINIDYFIKQWSLNINQNKGLKLNLALANFFEIVIQEYLPIKYWKHIDLEGFKFQRISILKDPTSGVENINILTSLWNKFIFSYFDKQASSKSHKNLYVKFLESSHPFPKDTYLFMEQNLRSKGAEVDADRVYRAMRHRDTEEPISIELQSRSQLFFDWIFRRGFYRLLSLTIGYGTQNFKLFYYFVFMFLVSFVLFLSPEAFELKPSYKSKSSPQSDPKLTCPQVFFQSLHTIIPVVPIPATEKWIYSDKYISLNFTSNCFNPLTQKPISIGVPYLQKINISYESYSSIFSIISWILFPLFLAGISGILRRQK